MNKRKYLKIAMLILPLLTLAAAAFPNSVAVKLGTEAEPVYAYYSHFSLVPMSYGHWGPMLTLMVICGLIVWSALYVFQKKTDVLVRVEAASGLGVVAAMSAYFFNAATVMGTAVMVLLMAEMVVSVLLSREPEEDG